MRQGTYITSEEAQDYFVGIRFKGGNPEVIFPHGYEIPHDEIELRKDTFRLLSVLRKFAKKTDGEKNENKNNDITSLPISSYQYVIFDFLANGYYTEKEVAYHKGLKGKINWKRTIQKEQPQLDHGNIVYLNFQIKKDQIKQDNLITVIHRYCVYQSFYRFGWLYLSAEYLPPNPHINLNKDNKQLFLATLRESLSSTFNDSKRRLFTSMINIIEENNEEIGIENLTIGVNDFAKVWERLVDYEFGEDNIDEFFPHSTWRIIKDGNVKTNSALEPDSIMRYYDKVDEQNKLFILDAKYYRYGLNESDPSLLPQSSDIQKQITYGKYAASKASKIGVDANRHIYNAFIMPFNAHGGESMKFVSVGTADWISYDVSTENYKYVLGILIDTKELIATYSKCDEKEIEKLAILIEDSLSSFRKAYPNIDD